MLNVSEPFQLKEVHQKKQTYPSPTHFPACRFLIFIVLGILTLSSCVSDRDTDKDGIPDKQDKCPTEYAKTHDGCPPEQKIKIIRFFIDRSASMNGYYGGQTEFVNNISDLLAKINAQSLINEIWLTSDTSEKFEGNTEIFGKKMQDIQPKGGKSSIMDNIFQTIAEKTATNDISLFVSDGILSYSDKEIKANRNINKDKASGLGTNIYTTFDRLRKEKDFAASVYAFKSSFNGTYYNYQNGKIKLKAEKRPYYMWIIGRKDLLRKFNNELSSITTFKPIEQMHFGLDEKTITKPNIISSIERSGNWINNDDNTGINDIGNKTAKFSLALNLSSLPRYAQQVNYLQTHVFIDPRGCLATIQIKVKKDVDDSKIRSDHQRATFDSATHIFIITVTKMNTKKATIDIRLPITPDTWYQNWSCNDDLDLKKTCAEQTFSFNYLIEGVVQAYQDNNKSYISISIPLKQ